MDTEHLRTFLEISRTRHFGQAARNLFLSQSAVSARIHALEEQVNAPLFHRTRNDIQLTTAGQRLVKYAENILETWHQARLDVTLEQQEQTPLRMAASTAVWDVYLKWRLAELRNQYSKSLVYAEVLEHENIIRRLSDGSLDVGLSLHPSHTPRIESSPIHQATLVLMSTEQELDYQQALVSPGFIKSNWGMNALDMDTTAQQTQALTSLPAGDITLQYLLSQGGSTYLAQAQIESAEAKGQLFTVKDAPAIEYVIYGHCHHKGSTAGDLEDMITRHMET